MRKLFLAAVALAATVTVSYAQDLKDVQEKISKGKYDEAKQQLDKFMADPKNAGNANAYYYKAQIQKYYAQTDSTGKLTYDASKESFDAYKKTLEMDPSNPLMKIDQNMGLFSLFQLHYDKGAKNYNNKNYDAAFTDFQKAIEVQDYIKSKNFSLPNYTPPALDTQLVLLTANSASLAKRQPDAIPYYERLANAKIGSPEYKDVYGLLFQYYLKKGDQATAAKYSDIGKQLYHDDDYWIGLEMGDLGNDHEAKVKKLGEMAQKYPNNAALAQEYVVELYNYAYVWDKKPADYTDRQAKLQSAIDNALKTSPNDAFLSYIASQHYYSQANDLEEERRGVVGNTPAAAAKRKDYNARIDKKYDDMAAASQKAFDYYSTQTSLKAQEKTYYRKSTDQLIDYYSRKKMNDKVTFYTNKKAEIK